MAPDNPNLAITPPWRMTYGGTCRHGSPLGSDCPWCGPPMHSVAFTLGGWQCPGCGTCWAPSVLACHHCPQKPAVPAEDFTGGAEHDLCVPPSEGGLCDHGSERTCTGGRHCSC